MPPITQPTELKDLLTSKEMIVAKLVMKGQTNASIAVELGVKPGTIQAHLVSIFKRLNIDNRVQLATRYLLECGTDV